uniref:Uncharacterized protein n=1 Tax=Triticum urartu TaxID=4572 RepID=A0A8R7PEZ8_TRIUA
MSVISLSRLQYRVVNEKCPLKNLILFRKWLASDSLLVQSLLSSGGVSGLASLIHPFLQHNRLVSYLNFVAWQKLQFGTILSTCVFFGMLL